MTSCRRRDSGGARRGAREAILRARGAAARWSVWAPGRSRRRGPAELLLVPPCACRARQAHRSGSRSSAAFGPLRPRRLAPAGPRALISLGEWGGWRGERPPSSFPAPARTFRRAPVPRPLRALPPSGRDAEPGCCALVAERGARPELASLNPHQTGPRRPSPRPEPPAAAGLERTGRTGRLCWNLEPRACLTHF